MSDPNANLPPNQSTVAPLPTSACSNACIASGMVSPSLTPYRPSSSTRPITVDGQSPPSMRPMLIG